MTYHLYLVKGWPQIAWSEAGRARFRREDYVGAYRSSDAALRVFDFLLAEARASVSRAPYPGAEEPVH